jgi:hypothetical protein
LKYSKILALSSTDDWMEAAIRKRQKKKGLSQVQSDSEDPFEEINQYLRLLRVRREDCPNPIPWWGVSILIDVL